MHLRGSISITMKLSVIIPCFNELKTIDVIVDAVKKSPYHNQEIIIVDDYSTDGTREILRNEIEEKVNRVIYPRIHHQKTERRGFRQF